MSNDGFSGLGKPPEGIEYAQVSPSMLGREEIESRFGTHKADEVSQAMHEAIRILYIDLAMKLDQLLPNTRAKSVALTELEDSSMWAHKAIAVNDPIAKD